MNIYEQRIEANLKCKRVMFLRCVDGLTFRQIGAVVGSSAAVATQRFEGARRKIAQCVTDYDDWKWIQERGGASTQERIKFLEECWDKRMEWIQAVVAAKQATAAENKKRVEEGRERNRARKKLTDADRLKAKIQKLRDQLAELEAKAESGL